MSSDMRVVRSFGTVRTCFVFVALDQKIIAARFGHLLIATALFCLGLAYKLPMGPRGPKIVAVAVTETETETETEAEKEMEIGTET